MTDSAAMITAVAKRRHVGIEVRHRRDCPAGCYPPGRCRCAPAYRAAVWFSDPRGRQGPEGDADVRSARRCACVAVAGGGAGSTRRWSESRAVWRRADGACGWGRAHIGDGVRRCQEAERTPYRAGVVRAYRRALNLHACPVLGGRRLDGVSQPDLLELVERLQAAGLSPSSIRNAIDPLRTIYRRAVARGLVAANPTSGLELPTGEKRRDRVADPLEAARLVEALPHLKDRALWAVALFCGLRAGELRALRWEHVGLARAAITVRESCRSTRATRTRRPTRRHTPACARCRSHRLPMTR